MCKYLAVAHVSIEQKSNYYAFQVNNNGHITPGRSSSRYTAVELPDNVPRIAVYWADVDTRPDDAGFVWYRTSTDSTLLEQVLDDIQRAYPSIEEVDYVLIATWDHVGYYRHGTDLV